MSNNKYCICIAVLLLLSQSSLGLSPVIFIPGDGGSQLEAKINKTNVVHYICKKTSDDYYNIWLNLELLVPFVIDCWVDNLRLDYDNVTRKTSNPPGVDIRVPGWGNPEPVEWLDPSHDSAGAYFNTIGDALVKIGYVRNVSLRGAPYDFRRAPNENKEFFVKLKTLVEETYAMNNKTAVTLLVHSMGGLMGQHFLRLQKQSWKDTYIRRMISLSTPWGGAMKALKTFAIDYFKHYATRELNADNTTSLYSALDDSKATRGHSGDDLGSLMLSETTMRAEQITCPSLAWLLPSSNFWKPYEVLVQTDKFNYTINDLQKLFTDLELPNAWEMRKDTEQFSRDFSAPGVELHCIYGHNISTVERLVYKPGTWLDGSPTLATGEGDGTVNLRSLNACERWAKRPTSYWKSNSISRFMNSFRKNKVRKTDTLNGRPLKVVPLKGAEHLKILHDPRVITYITTILKND